jgi:hypothetical protein
MLCFVAWFLKCSTVYKNILSRVWVTETRVWIVIVFINNLQVVTANNNHTLAYLHNLQSFHINLFGLFSLIFTIHSQAMDI